MRQGIARLQTEEITLEELSELLELGTWMHGYRGYVITEEFDGKEIRVFNVEDLHIEISDGWVMFYDYNKVMIGSVLMAQLRESILSVCHEYYDFCLHDVINFSTGHVHIDAIVA